MKIQNHILHFIYTPIYTTTEKPKNLQNITISFIDRIISKIVFLFSNPDSVVTYYGMFFYLKMNRV